MTRRQRYEQRLRGLGLVRLQCWVHADDLPAVRAYIDAFHDVRSDLA